MSWRAGHADRGGALGQWDDVPVAVCRLSVGNGRGPVNRCTLNIDTWDYSHAPLCSGIRKHCFLKARSFFFTRWQQPHPRTRAPTPMPMPVAIPMPVAMPMSDSAVYDSSIFVCTHNLVSFYILVL
jgi:hypothetical protein